MDGGKGNKLERVEITQPPLLFNLCYRGWGGMWVVWRCLEWIRLWKESKGRKRVGDMGEHLHLYHYRTQLLSSHVHSRRKPASGQGLCQRGLIERVAGGAPQVSSTPLSLSANAKSRLALGFFLAPLPSHTRTYTCRQLSMYEKTIVATTFPWTSRPFGASCNKNKTTYKYMIEEQVRQGTMANLRTIRTYWEDEWNDKERRVVWCLKAESARRFST